MHFLVNHKRTKERGDVQYSVNGKAWIPVHVMVGQKPEAGSWRPPHLAAVNILEAELWGDPQSPKRETQES